MDAIAAIPLIYFHLTDYAVDEIIYEICKCHGNLYAVEKEILKIRDNLDLGGVRKPLPGLIEEDLPIVMKCVDRIDALIEKYCQE